MNIKEFDRLLDLPDINYSSVRCALDPRYEMDRWDSIHRSWEHTVNFRLAVDVLHFCFDSCALDNCRELRRQQEVRERAASLSASARGLFSRFRRAISDSDDEEDDGDLSAEEEDRKYEVSAFIRRLTPCVDLDSRERTSSNYSFLDGGAIRCPLVWAFNRVGKVKNWYFEDYELIERIKYRASIDPDFTRDDALRLLDAYYDKEFKRAVRREAVVSYVSGREAETPDPTIDGRTRSDSSKLINDFYHNDKARKEYVDSGYSDRDGKVDRDESSRLYKKASRRFDYKPSAFFNKPSSKSE